MRGRLVLCTGMLVVVVGVGSSALAANAPNVPRETNCGDMAGPAWHFLVVGEARGSTGSHYTVGAINMPCTTARALAAKLIRKRSRGPALNAVILAGYMCMIGDPPGRKPLMIGSCFADKAGMMGTSGERGFNWHHCEYVQGTGAHPTCRWTYFTR
jgi:hypothetical protein